MNLFDQITWKSSVQWFFWQKKSETPSFQLTQQPVAPRTSSYVQPPITNTIFPQQSTQSFQQPVQQPVQEDSITTQLKAKGYNDKDIEFLKQAKQKGYTSQQAFWYLDSKKKPQQPVQETPITEKFKIKSSEKFWVIEWVKDFGKFLINLPADSAQVVWWLYDAVTSPINTLSTTFKTLEWVSDKAVYSVANSISSALGGKTVWPTQEAQMIDALWGYIKDTYWTAWKFKKAVVENPADTLLTLMGWLWVVSKVAEANNMTNVVNNINKIQQVINPVNILKQEAKLVTKPIGYIGKEVIPQVLGKTTWTSAETIRTAFTQGWTPEFQAALRWETTPQNILSNVQEWMQAIKNDRAIAYWSDYVKLQANKTQLPIDDVAKSFIKSLKDEYKILVWKDGLDFSQSKITWGTSQSQIENMYKDIVWWKDKTPEWLDVLKQRLQDYYRGTPESSKWDRLSTIASNAIKKKIVDNVPEYANMTANYEKLTNDIRDITKTLSLWDKTQAQTAITKLSSVLRENFSARQDMVKLIEQYSGKNIQWQIAWASLNPLLAKWLAWVITWGWVVFWQLANPAFWWWLALASPRLIGEIANTIWVPIQKFKSAINNLKNANTTFNTTRSAMEWSTKVKPFTKTPIVTPKVTPKKITPTPEIKSSTQARWPIDPTTWKRKTIVQSPTAYEAWIRRPYTLNGNKPIVKRASDVDSWLIEEKIPKPDEKFLAKFAEWKTLDEFMWFVRGSSTQYWGYEPRLRRYLRPESKRLNELVPKDPNTRMITIYRWIDKSENPRIKSEIKWWDFVTTSYDDALSYADSPANVVSKRVPISTLVTEFPEEFIKNNKWKSIGEIVDYELIWKPYDHPFIKVTDNQLKQIYEQAKSPQKTVKPLTEWKQSATMGDMETKKLIEEARKYKSAEEFVDWVFWAEKWNTYKNVPKDLIDNEYLDYLDNEIYFKQKIDKWTVESWKERIKKWERPPIKIDDTNWRFELWDGYHRYQAYKELWFEKIPVFYKSELKLLFDKIKKE